MAAPVRVGEPLAQFTTFRVGGPAARLLEVGDAERLIDEVRSCDREGEPVLVLAGGSNLLISDAGFGGTVLRVGLRGITAAGDEDAVRVRVGAGEPWDEFVAWAVAEGLIGIEALSGIPGSAGATPIQNVGAYGQEVASVVAAVHVWDRLLGSSYSLGAEHCGFSYRDSLFKRTGRFVVTAVEFRLRRARLGCPVAYAELARALDVTVGESAPAAAVREAVLGLRRSKGMVLDAADHDTWSAGSFFTNPVLSVAAAAELPEKAPRYDAPGGTIKTSAAWLIENAGFAKGHGSGPARLSTKHTLALTNRGSATATDLVELAREIRAGVEAKFGIRLEPEPVLVGLTL
ncbi:MAG TPA: UDP-N-acetylmuramate dehydrogenase [Sporichthyaceae bacterium]|nr:UDP-N-acetylmuramate dehydrogenase [Sporichthyaceae bacterium]